MALPPAYEVLTFLAVVLLAILLFREYRTRDLAVTGARLDALEIELRLADCFANTHRLRDNNPILKRARVSLSLAMAAYRKKDLTKARIHIHNASANLDLVTQDLVNHATLRPHHLNPC